MNVLASDHYRANLVKVLRDKGVIRTPRIETAFLQVPRESFVPAFFVRDPTTNRMVWHEVTMADPNYLEKVYQDDALVTHLDARQFPDSSSSKPSIMAMMLEALDIQPGHSVLEIGTGTGYHAALLASLTGDASLVTTLDRDDLLLAQARQAIEEHGGTGMHIVKADGFEGYPLHAPYDRIIATASVPTVPMAWVEQLRVGGKLVMDLQGSLTASGFLLIEKTTEGITGQFHAQPLYFMPLVMEKQTTPQLPSTDVTQNPCLGSFVLEKGHVFPDILFDMAFRWFLQWRIYGCKISHRKQLRDGEEIHAIYLMESWNQGVIRLRKEEDRWYGSIYNAPSVWHDVQQAYEEWVRLGRPNQAMYVLEIDEAKDLATLVIGSLKLPVY
jgi:protein-L-isoaspartate(D-aspartate) O-methyltransferase